MMSRKGFLVKVELEIQRVSCPGVWLCSNGKVSLQLHMLDSSIQTESKRSSFPINCMERYIFYKSFPDERRLNELQRKLNSEWVHAELVQWRSCDEGRVLATFSATLDDVLYPASSRGMVSGTNLDLLMEPTALFPGTIAPKLEISTKTTIEEIFCEIDENCSHPSTVVANPKIIVSNPTSSNLRENKTRKVCHSVAYSRARKYFQGNKQKRSKPVFKYQRPEDDLILRTNPNKVFKDDKHTPTRNFRKTLENAMVKHCSRERPCSCYCKVPKNGGSGYISYSRVFRENMDDDNGIKTDDVCPCGKIHKEISCPICLRYEGYFSSEGSKERTTLRAYTSAPVRCEKCSTKEHLRSCTGSPCPSDIETGSSTKIKDCICSSAASAVECASRARDLARELHERVSNAITTNSRLLAEAGCTDCCDR